MSRKLPNHVACASAVVRTLPDLGKWVRNQRAQNRLRIDDTAALCGVSGDLLSRLENGKSVTTEKLLAVLQSLGLRMLIVPAGDVPWIEAALSEHRATLDAQTQPDPSKP